MAANEGGETMRHRKRFAIKVLAVGFAVGAFAAPSALSMPPPEDLPGDQVRALREAKGKNLRTSPVRSPQRARVVRRPIREYEPEVSG
jgi:hypothetical protein